MRVSPPRIVPDATLAPKPPMASPGADAHRQTAFVLGGELDMVLRGLELEGGVAAASAGAKFRKQVTAAGLALWSRGWLSRLGALHAAQVGNYVGAIALVRAAADFLAAEVALIESGAAEWTEWLEQGGIAQAPADHANEFELHPFRSGEALARHEELGTLYRAASDFSMPHFGTTLLLAGADSTPERVAVTFGDRDFHFALAQLVLGWLAQLSAFQVQIALEHEGVFGTTDRDALASHASGARALAAAKDRCRVEVVERGGVRRYLVHNWRRQPSGAPKRILL